MAKPGKENDKNAIRPGAAHETIMNVEYEGASCQESLRSALTRLHEAKETVKGLREDKAELLTQVNALSAEKNALEQKVKEQIRLIDIYVDTLTAYQIELAKCQGVG